LNPPRALAFIARTTIQRQHGARFPWKDPDIVPTTRALLLLALAAPALAVTQTAPAAAQETRRSAETKLDGEFAASDTNKDGFLSQAEVLARMSRMKVAGGKTLDPAQAKKIATLFVARADTNKDGKVSEAESQALMSNVFAKYDLNHDGRVDGQEAAAARAAAKGAATKSGPPKGR
jgi:Ca2+-binding EF-hand superfamily protein